MVMTWLASMSLRDMRSSNSAHFSTRREACFIRRAAVERNSLTSARSSSDIGLVCATALIMSYGGLQKLGSIQKRAHKERLGSEISCAHYAFGTNDLRHDILRVLNLGDTPKHTAPSQLRDRRRDVYVNRFLSTPFRAASIGRRVGTR